MAKVSQTCGLVLYSGSFNFVLVFVLVHAFFMDIDLYYNLESSMVIPLAVLFLLRIALAIQGLFSFNMTFKIVFYISVKNATGILSGIELTPWLTFLKTNILIIIDSSNQ